MPTSRTRRSRQRGSTLVELSLVLLVMIWILVGTVDIGQVLYFHHNLTLRARTAAQWAATRTYNETQVRNKVIYDNPAGGANPVLSGLNTTVDGASIVGVQLLDAGTTSARLRIRIQNYPYRFFTPGIAGAYAAKPVIASFTHEPSLP
jgi:Flp pilus assembly protein TadG